MQNQDFDEKAQAIQETKYVGVGEQIAFYVSAMFRDMSYAVMGKASTFFVDVLGLKESQLATLMLAEKLWDGVNDPLMGAYFDRRTYTTEKARRFFKTTAIPIALLIVMMYFPFKFSADPVVNSWICMGLMFICYIPFEALHTINGTAYMSYYNSITPNISERSGIISRSRMFSTMGSAAVSGIIPILYGMIEPDDVQGKKTIFLSVAVIVAAAFLIYNALMYTQVKERIMAPPPQEKQKVLSIFAGLLKNKILLILILSNAIGGIISAGDTGIYFYTYNVGNAGWQAYIGIFGLPCLLLATWLLPKLCQRFEKRTIVLACSASKILLKLLYLALGLSPGIFNMTSLNTGAGLKVLLALFAVVNALPDTLKSNIYWSMIADSVDYLEWRTGKRNDGTIYAMEGLMGKIIGSIGAMSTGIIIKLIRFVPNAKLLEQPARAVSGLFWLPIVIEIVSTIASTTPYLFYDFKRKDHSRMIEELKERNALARNSG